MIFISLKTHIKHPKVCVTIGDKEHNFPLSREGCVKAGQFLQKNGKREWMYSSSVDHSEEWNKYLKTNPADIIEAAYDAVVDEKDAKRKNVIIKILDWCDTTKFQDNLTKEEKAIYKDIVAESRKRNK